jgi:MFS superfamily sulfate permease-like transporter
MTKNHHFLRRIALTRIKSPIFSWDSIAITITQLAFHLSVAKIMSTDCDYKVDDRQEMYAVGSTLIFTGFFPVFPGTNGLGRPLILRECGATSAVSFCGVFLI